MINVGATDGPNRGIQNIAFLPELPSYSALPSTIAPSGGQLENAVSAPQSVPCTRASENVQNGDQTTSTSAERSGEDDRAPPGAHERQASKTSPGAHDSKETLDVESAKKKEVISQPADNVTQKLTIK